MVQKGKFTKHYFEGSSRIVSKLGEGTFSHKNTGIMAGGLDYLTRSKKEEEIRQRYIKGLQVPPGPPTQHGIYASPKWTKQPYPSIDWEAISQNQEPPAGWPRYPRFNEPGDVPGPPVQFGPPITNKTAKAGFNFIPNGVEEKNLYYYHPDHLGSSSYITDRNGEVIQHIEYIAFGETFVDEHSTTNKMPYLFNGKELDYETGLYYYGARYYDPKVSIFLNVDPLVEKTGTPYAYTYNNPIRYIDPTGMEPEDDHFNKFGNFLYSDNKLTKNIIVHTETGKYNLSQLNYQKKGTLKAVANIIAYYAREKGIRGIVGVGTFETEAAAHTRPDGSVYFNTKSLKSGVFDNLYNVKSALNHEIGHINEPKLAPYTFEQHSNIYLAEASHPDFAKTTQKYKASQAFSFIQRVLNAEEKERNNSKSFMNLINSYNKNNTGNVSIGIYTGGSGSIKNATINIKVGNSKLKPQKYEDIKNPNN